MANVKIPKTGHVEFHSIPYLVEIFPSPILKALKTLPYEVTDKNDLIRSSNHFGFNEFFFSEEESVLATIEGKEEQVSTNDFLLWQLERMSSEGLYKLINKVGAKVTNILDFEAEFKMDADYSPEDWMNSYNDEFLEKGIDYIDRLKAAAAEEFYSIIIESLLDNNYGIVEFLETEIDDELKSLQKYKDWDCDIVIVSTGQFFPYIEDGSNMMLDDFRLREMFVRNYDEGDID